MDETPVFLDLVPNKVVDRKGKKTVRVRTNGSEKNRITAALCCTAAGKLLPPFVMKMKNKTPTEESEDPIWCCLHYTSECLDG